jgi:hypothetical protein
MLQRFALVAGLSLILPLVSALAQTPPPVVQFPSDLPTGERWLRHFQEDLLPFWNVPDAFGTPRGNFPFFFALLPRSR